MDGLDSRKPALLLIFILSASLFSASFAGIPRKFMGDPAKEMPRTFFHRGGEARAIERVLRVKTNDYGRYDAAPTLVKPPFKLIPN